MLSCPPACASSLGVCQAHGRSSLLGKGVAGPDASCTRLALLCHMSLQLKLGLGMHHSVICSSAQVWPTLLPCIDSDLDKQVERLQRKFASIHSTLSQQPAPKRDPPGSPRIAAKMGAQPRGPAQAAAAPAGPLPGAETKVSMLWL